MTRLHFERLFCKWCGNHVLRMWWYKLFSYLEIDYCIRSEEKR